MSKFVKKQGKLSGKTAYIKVADKTKSKASSINRKLVQNQMKRKYIRNLQKDRFSKRGVKKGGTNSSVEGMQETLPFQSRTADSSDASRYAEDKVTGTAKAFTSYSTDRLFVEGQSYAKARHMKKSLRKKTEKSIGADKGMVKKNQNLDGARLGAKRRAVKDATKANKGLGNGKVFGKRAASGDAIKQGFTKALNGMAELFHKSAATLSLTSIMAIAVILIVVVVMVLGLTISAPFGEYDLELSDNDFVNIALSQVGTRSGEMYWKWYGFNSEVEWCACFVSWCANEAGLLKEGELPKFAWVPSGALWFQQKDSWYENGIIPEPGMIIFFDWYDETLDDEGNPIGQDGAADHVGIVEKVKDGYVYTVEGNTTDEGICKEKKYPLGYYEILGYGKAVDV